MTSPAVQLAIECGVLAYERFKESDVETFYARAQAQALRDAAENVTIWAEEFYPVTRYRIRDQIRSLADELENQK